MGITVDKAKALSVLLEAFELAVGKAALPSDWEETTASIASSPSKTYTVALGTGLLARATDARVDALALKETSGSRAYSARGIAHDVLVPTSRDLGFDLRATGREPLNNQPFFRYDRIDVIERVHSGARASLAELVAALRKANTLDTADALLALAAFLRNRRQAFLAKTPVLLSGGDLQLRTVMAAADALLAHDAEGGKRAQALVAAAYDLVFETVEMGRINDPSRHDPGDVHAKVGRRTIVAVEVRHKPIKDSEILAFARQVSERGIPSAAVAAFSDVQGRIDDVKLFERADADYGVPLAVFGSVDSLLRSAFTWAPRGTHLADEFATRFIKRLEEIEASPETTARFLKLLEA